MQKPLCSAVEHVPMTADWTHGDEILIRALSISRIRMLAIAAASVHPMYSMSGAVYCVGTSVCLGALLK
jgi:hypothetical protein